MPAVFALLIGITAGDGASWVPPVAMPVESESDLSPVLNGAPADRRNGAGSIADDETLGILPPGAGGAVSIERRIIIRIPMIRAPVVQPPAFLPKLSTADPARQRSTCLSLRTIKGASIEQRTGILFVTSSDARYQAVLERGCRPVDFQSGFYLTPSGDGALCAGRDMLHARSGLKCTITGLTRLTPGM